jgi:hypothetical protein
MIVLEAMDVINLSKSKIMALRMKDRQSKDTAQLPKQI